MIGIALLEFDRKVIRAFQEAIQKLRGLSHGKDLIRDLEPLVQALCGTALRPSPSCGSMAGCSWQTSPTNRMTNGLVKSS